MDTKKELIKEMRRIIAAAQRIIDLLTKDEQ
jgi:hypothetical protein